MYPLPLDECERLAALQQLAILDSPPEPGFDGIVRLASSLFDMPIALVSLLDRDRQWFKAKLGLVIDETPRDQAFCAHAVCGRDVMVVEDALEDPRFQNNPLVTGCNGIRFYAGAPVLDRAGVALGTLCLLDRQPRRISAEQATQLKALAALVTDQIELLRRDRALQAELEARAAAELRLQAQQTALLRRERLIQQTSRLAHVGGWEMDLQSGALHWSEEVFNIHELSVDRPISVELALSFYPPAARHQVQEAIETALHTGKPFDLELPLITARGRTRWVRTIGEAEFENGQPVRLFGTFQDRTLEREREERIAHLASHDALTGLANRRKFSERLEEIVRQGGSKAALLLVDVDHFKEINDTLGHEAGDAVLREVAERLARQVRPQDLVARLGGDEFAVLLTDLASRDQGIAVMNRLLQAFHPPFFHDGRVIRATATIGMALAPDDSRQPSELMRYADAALYQAKFKGRSCGSTFDSSIKDEIDRRCALEADLHQAIEEDEFTLLFQPKINLTDGSIEGFEALVRWQHPRHGELRPDSFIELVDGSGLSMAFDDLILRKAAAQMRSWADQGVAFNRVAVNLSPALCRSEHLASRVLAVLESFEVPATSFEVELTERVFLGRATETVILNLQRLRAAGVLIAFDDFGTGYASLTHLKRFPVDRLKIDRSFVSDIEHDQSDAAIVRAVLRLGQSLGLDVVAEGLENETQRRFLLAEGCHLGQGYRFAPPLPANRVAAFIKGWAGAGQTNGCVRRAA